MILKKRKATIEEYDIILSLLKQAADWLKREKINHWQVWLNPTEERLNWIKEGLEQQQFYFVYEEHTDKLIGMYRLMFSDELYWGKKNKKAGYMHSLVIKEEHKGNNIGRKILTDIEQLLRDKSISLFRLDCNADNEKLYSYYISQGFEKVGETVMPHSRIFLFEKKLIID